MAEDLTAPDDELEPGQDRIAITRDPSFVRLIVDEFTIISRTIGVDISLIALGPEPSDMVVEIDGKTGGVQPVNVESIASYTEVARARFAVPTALRMAMNIIERFVRGGFITVEPFKAAFLEMLDEAGREKAAAQSAASTEESQKA